MIGVIAYVCIGYLISFAVYWVCKPDPLDFEDFNIIAVIWPLFVAAMLFFHIHYFFDKRK